MRTAPLAFAFILLASFGPANATLRGALDNLNDKRGGGGDPEPKEIKGRARKSQLEALGPRVELDSYPELKVWHDPAVAESMDKVFAMQADGLYNPDATVKKRNRTNTYAAVFARFAEHGCPVLLHGGAVRDAIRNGALPKDLDLSFSCTFEEALDICATEQWACPESNANHTHITFTNDVPGGALEPLEGNVIEHAAYTDVCVFESTANSMMYDPRTKNIIDYTGVGYSDVKKGHVRLAPGCSRDMSKLALWLQDSPSRWPRSVKLIEKGYRFVDGFRESLVRVAKDEDMWRNITRHLNPFFYKSVAGLPGWQVTAVNTCVDNEHTHAKIQKIFSLLALIKKHFPKDIYSKVETALGKGKLNFMRRCCVPDRPNKEEKCKPYVPQPPKQLAAEFGVGDIEEPFDDVLMADADDETAVVDDHWYEVEEPATGSDEQLHDKYMAILS